MTQDARPSRSPTPRDCVVLLSGGLDSAACVALCKNQNISVTALHVSYGQAAAPREAIAAKAIAHHYNVPFRHVCLQSTRPKADGEILGRNTLLVSLALTELDTTSALIALGIHAGTPYFDCSDQFVAEVQRIIDRQCDGRVRLVAPFIDWTKADIWTFCRDHAVPISLTYSCERGYSSPCGACLSCRDLRALRAS